MACGDHFEALCSMAEQALMMELTAVDLRAVNAKDPLPWYQQRPVDHASQARRTVTPAAGGSNNPNPTGSIMGTDIAMSKNAARAEFNRKEDARLAKKTELETAFALCGARCQCGQTPCPVEGLKKCKTCVRIQRSLGSTGQCGYCLPKSKRPRVDGLLALTNE